MSVQYKCDRCGMIMKPEMTFTVEVVRCKDCKHAHMTYDGLCKYCDTWKDDDGNLLELYLDGDYYCADGERKGE